jgi:hypothetical protein
MFRNVLKLLGRPLVYSDNKTVVRKIETTKGPIKRTVNEKSTSIGSCGVYRVRKHVKKQEGGQLLPDEEDAYASSSAYADEEYHKDEMNKLELEYEEEEDDQEGGAGK